MVNNKKEQLLSDILDNAKKFIDSGPCSEETYNRMRADGPAKVAKVLARGFLIHYEHPDRKNHLSEDETNELLNELITGKHNQRIAAWLGMA